MSSLTTTCLPHTPSPTHKFQSVIVLSAINAFWFKCMQKIRFTHCSKQNKSCSTINKLWETSPLNGDSMISLVHLMLVNITLPLHNSVLQSTRDCTTALCSSTHSLSTFQVVLGEDVSTVSQLLLQLLAPLRHLVQGGPHHHRGGPRGKSIQMGFCLCRCSNSVWSPLDNTATD